MKRVISSCHCCWFRRLRGVSSAVVSAPSFADVRLHSTTTPAKIDANIPPPPPPPFTPHSGLDKGNEEDSIPQHDAELSSSSSSPPSLDESFDAFVKSLVRSRRLTVGGPPLPFRDVAAAMPDPLLEEISETYGGLVKYVQQRIRLDSHRLTGILVGRPQTTKPCQESLLKLGVEKIHSVDGLQIALCEQKTGHAGPQDVAPLPPAPPPSPLEGLDLSVRFFLPAHFFVPFAVVRSMLLLQYPQLDALTSTMDDGALWQWIESLAKAEHGGCVPLHIIVQDDDKDTAAPLPPPSGEPAQPSGAGSSSSSIEGRAPLYLKLRHAQPLAKTVENRYLSHFVNGEARAHDFDAHRLARFLHTDKFVPLSSLEYLLEDGVVTADLVHIVLSYPDKFQWLEAAGGDQGASSSVMPHTPPSPSSAPSSASSSASHHPEHQDLVRISRIPKEVRFVLSPDTITSQLTPNKYDAMSDSEMTQLLRETKQTAPMKAIPLRRKIVRARQRRKFPHGTPFLDLHVRYYYLYDSMEPGVQYTVEDIRDQLFAPIREMVGPLLLSEMTDHFPHLFMTSSEHGNFQFRVRRLEHHEVGERPDGGAAQSGDPASLPPELSPLPSSFESDSAKLLLLSEVVRALPKSFESSRSINFTFLLGEISHHWRRRIKVTKQPSKRVSPLFAPPDAPRTLCLWNASDWCRFVPDDIIRLDPLLKDRIFIDLEKLSSLLSRELGTGGNDENAGASA